MRGERLEKVIAAAELLLERLGPDDALSLVSFSDRAEVVLPAMVLGATGGRDTVSYTHLPTPGDALHLQRAPHPRRQPGHLTRLRGHHHALPGL